MTRGNYKVQDVETSKHTERDTSYRTCILSLFIFLILCIIIFVIAWTTWKPLSGITEVYLHQDRPEGGHSRINDIVTESNPWKTTKMLHLEVGTTRHSLPTTARTNFSKLLPPNTSNRTEQSNVKIATNFYTRSTTSSNISKINSFTLSQTTPPSTFSNDSTTEDHHETTSSVSPNGTIVFIIDNSSVVITPSLNVTSPSVETNWNISVVTKMILRNSTMTKMLASETIIRTSQAAINIPTTPATAINNTYEDTIFYDRPTDVTGSYHDDSPPEKSSNVQPVDDISTTLHASYTHFLNNRKQHDIIAINGELSTQSTEVNIFTLNVTDHPSLNTKQHKINVKTDIPASSTKYVTSSIFVLGKQQTDITNITRKTGNVIPTEDITEFREETTISEEEGKTITPSSQAIDIPNVTDNETITRSSESIGVINTTEEIIILSTELIDNINTEEETITLSSEPIDFSNTTEEITILSTKSIYGTNNTEEETISLSSEPIFIINTTEEIIVPILYTKSIDDNNNIEEETITLSSELIDVTVTTEEESSSESIKVTVVTPIGAKNSTISKYAETHNSNTSSENQITTASAVFSVNTSISRNSTT